jgi:dienelactone hydrolase
LRIPRLGTDRLPAVILLHGSGGIGANVDYWSQELNGIGLATFITDSFTARGIQSTVANQEMLGRLNMTYYAYRALGALAAHPRIDPTRIVLMGFSRGGQATLYASLKRFQRMHAPEGMTFAAYVPFYAPCFTTYIADEDVSDKPIRMFHGSADNYVPVAPCRAYVVRLRKVGKDVNLTEYPNAHHAFDNMLLKIAVAPQSQTTRRCTMVEQPEGTIINAVTKQPFSNGNQEVQAGLISFFLCTVPGLQRFAAVIDFSDDWWDSAQKYVAHNDVTTALWVWGESENTWVVQTQHIGTVDALYLIQCPSPD